MEDKKDLKEMIRDLIKKAEGEPVFSGDMTGPTKSEQHTRVFMFPQKGLKDMTKQEKISACYQHACLMYEDGEAVNNQSVRERFELNKNDSSIASRIISDTVEAGLIKPADNETTSKKYMTYIPFYG